MIVAVFPVRMMQVPVDQIVHMVTVRDDLMAATRTMHMGMVVAERVSSHRSATIRICFANFDHVLINVIAMGMMQMAIVEIVNVVSMLDGNVAAASPVLVIVMVVMWQIAVAHEGSFFGQ